MRNLVSFDAMVSPIHGKVLGFAWPRGIFQCITLAAASGSVFLYFVNALVTGDVSPAIFQPVAIIFGATGLRILTARWPHSRSTFIVRTFLLVFSLYSILAIGIHRERIHYTNTMGRALPTVGNENTFHAVSESKALEKSNPNAILPEPFEDPVEALNIIGYPYLLIVVQNISILLTGKTTFLGLVVLNCLFGSLLAIIIYAIAIAIGQTERAARLALAATAAFPIHIYFSCVVMRDILIALLIAMAVLVTLGFRKGYSLRKIAMISVLCLFVFFLRNISALALVAGIALSLYWMRRDFLGRAIALGIIALGAVFVAIPLLIYGDTITGGIDSVDTYFDKYQSWAQERADDQSIGARLYDLPEPFKTTALLFYGFLAPIPPTAVLGYGFYISSFLLDTGTLAWYYCAFWLPMGLRRKNLNNPGIKLIIILSVIFLIGIALSSVNLRHKLQFVSLLMIPIAGAWDASTPRQRKWVHLLMVAMGFLLVALYLALKLVIS